MKISIIIFLILLLIGCKKDEIDPHQQILGKWEIFYLGNGEYREPIKNPTAYMELLPDSVLLAYNYDTGTTLRSKYWIDTQFHMGFYREDGVLISFDYKYQFDKDTLTLEAVNVNAIFHVSKYKRIN